MTITSLFPRRTGTVDGQYVPRHAKPYNRVVDIVRKNSTVVPARHSTDPTSVRAVFPR